MLLYGYIKCVALRLRNSYITNVTLWLHKILLHRGFITVT